MLVINRKREKIGTCEVDPKRLTGKWFIVPIAIEGDYCQACGIRHTHFQTISFAVCWNCTPELALMAENIQHAKKLPGWQRAQKTIA